MKSFSTRLYLPVVLLFVLFQSILSGCVEATIISATQTAAIVKTSTPVITINILTQTPFLASTVKFADYLSGCNNSIVTLSPDAKWAIAQCAPNGEYGIFVWKIGEQQATMLFKSKALGGYDATFSPDGEKLLVAILTGPLWLFEVGRWQTPKMLYSELPRYAFPTWSPDSQSIAISYLVKGQALSIMKLDGTYKNLIAVDEVNSAGDSYGINMFGPAWSPDSSKIAYVIAKDMRNPSPIQLWTVDVASGKKELLYSGKAGEVAYEPEWSPDGSNILVVNGMATNKNMYLYNVKEKTFSLLPKFDDPFPTLWSPNGKYIGVCDLSGLYIVSIETGESSFLSPYCGILWKDDKSIVAQGSDWNFYLITLP